MADDGSDVDALKDSPSDPPSTSVLGPKSAIESTGKTFGVSQDHEDGTAGEVQKQHRYPGVAMVRYASGLLSLMNS